MIYRERTKKPMVTIINDDCRAVGKRLYGIDNAIVVTDPPFNIGYHYRGYKDRMNENDYYAMLSSIVQNMPSIIIHYPEQLHRLTLESGIVPSKVVSWYDFVGVEIDAEYFGISRERISRRAEECKSIEILNT